MLFQFIDLDRVTIVQTTICNRKKEINKVLGAAEQLSSAMGGGARTLVRQQKTAVVFLRKSPKPGGSQSVKHGIDIVFDTYDNIRNSGNKSSRYI